VSDRIKVLDHGWVELYSHMGSDESIYEVARNSVGGEPRSFEDAKRLIRSLMKHRHTSPFEFGEIVFRICAPDFVVKHFLRHRTASFNEVSKRYSVMGDTFHQPTEACKQSKSNKQCRTSELVSEHGKALTLFDTANRMAYSIYEELLDLGVCREQARLVLPSTIYTQLFYKQDLHNLMHFLSLRLDDGAQAETRAYAQAMHSIAAELFPLTIGAFSDYILGGCRFSFSQMLVLSNFVTNTNNEARQLLSDLVDGGISDGHLGRREGKAMKDCLLLSESL
jgi:thymidylate synthase (FAD)